MKITLQELADLIQQAATMEDDLNLYRRRAADYEELYRISQKSLKDLKMAAEYAKRGYKNTEATK